MLCPPNSDCFVIALLETGILKMHEPETVVRLKTPGSIVEAAAHFPTTNVLPSCSKCRRVSETGWMPLSRLRGWDWDWQR